MALLFSAVTVTAETADAEFLVFGIPASAEDLEDWTAFSDLLDRLDREQDLSVHVETYLYGEGETVRATPEEVAYLTMRSERDPAFLSRHCDNIADSDFTVQFEPEETEDLAL